MKRMSPVQVSRQRGKAPLCQTLELADFALNNNLDISFIAEMPLGEISSHERDAEFISSQDLRNILSRRFTLSESNFETGGPSRYWNAEGFTSKLGFISPHSENFCSTCNRVRVTTSGRLLLCLGNEHSVDLRKVLRSNTQNPISELQKTIINAMAIKPEKHEFNLAEEPQILRFMNTTGG